MLDFYAPFLSHLHAKDSTGTLAILAHAHIGGTPDVGVSTRYGHSGNLAMQVDSALEAYDALGEAYPTAKIIIIAHSVGAWISLQVK